MIVLRKKAFGTRLTRLKEPGRKESLKDTLARLIQHEVGHLNSKYFIDYAPEGELLSLEEYWQKGQQAIESEE